MSFLKSVLFGAEGSYNIFGIQVKFEDDLPSYYSPVSLEGVGLISKMALKCQNSHALRWVTQGYAHVFIHEMTHALAFKLLTRQHSEVHISKSLCEGGNICPPMHIADWKQTIIDVAGPMGNIAFSTLQIGCCNGIKKLSFLADCISLGKWGCNLDIWRTSLCLYFSVK